MCAFRAFYESCRLYTNTCDLVYIRSLQVGVVPEETRCMSASEIPLEIMPEGSRKRTWKRVIDNGWVIKKFLHSRGVR